MQGAEAVLACSAGIHCCHATQDNTSTVCSLFREHMCGKKSSPVAFIVVNRNLCVNFYEAAFNFCPFYCLLVRTIMSADLFVTMNCSLSVSAEKAETGKIAAQQILACVTVCVCMCMPIGKNNVVLHVVVHVRGLKTLITIVLKQLLSKLAPSLPAHVTFIPRGGP